MAEKIFGTKVDIAKRGILLLQSEKIRNHKTYSKFPDLVQKTAKEFGLKSGNSFQLLICFALKTYFPEILEAIGKKIGMTKEDEDLINHQKNEGPMSKELVAFLKSNPNLEEYENVLRLSKLIDEHASWIKRGHLLCAIRKWNRNTVTPLKTGAMFEDMMKTKEVPSDD